MSKPPIVFLGTGPVAARSLELLLQDFEVEAVITKPVPEHHKESFPVTELCSGRNLRIIEVSSKSDIAPALRANNLESQVGIVIDFGIILDQETLDFFPFGMINSHFSLLPEWRGADPITFSLLSGQRQTGVTIAKVTLSLDEGPILAKERYAIPPKINIQQLTDDLIGLSGKLLAEYIPKYLNNQLNLAEQTGDPTYSRKLTKADGQIDLTKSAEVLEREVRAYLGWPGSKLKLSLKDGKELEVTVTEAEVTTEKDDSPLTLKTSKDYLKITRLKLPGKNEMTVKDFLNGYRDKLN